jgi:hypothetical protein
MIGTDMQREAIIATLDACLLTKEEQAQPTDHWREAFPPRLL